MKKLFCLLVAMFMVVNASAAVPIFVGVDTLNGATTAGDGTWGDINCWQNVDVYANPAIVSDATALPVAADTTIIASQASVASPTYGMALLDSNYNAGPAIVDAPGAQGGTLLVGHVEYRGWLNITSAGTLNAAALYVGHTGGNSGSVVNNAGTLTVGGDIGLGYTAVDSTLNNSGDMTVGGNLGFFAQQADFNMSGGTVDIAGNIDMTQGLPAHIQLDSGTVEASGLLFDQWYQDTVDITAGVLILDGDWTGQVVWSELTGQPDQSQSYGLAWWTTAVPFEIDTENERWITQMSAYGGAGTVMYDYDITNPGQTTIWASPVPEPATMVLLGLGAVLLRRRK